MQIGKSILNIRKENDLSQEQFAKQFHVTRQTVSNWENEKSYPDLQTLIAISDKYEVSLDNLMKQNPKMIKTIDRQRKWLKRAMVLFVFVLIIFVIYWWMSPQRMEGKVDRVLFEYENNELYTSDEFHEAARLVVEDFKTCGGYKDCELVVVSLDADRSEGSSEKNGKEVIILNVYYTVGCFPTIDYNVPGSSNSIHWQLERKSPDSPWEITGKGEG